MPGRCGRRRLSFAFWFVLAHPNGGLVARPLRRPRRIVGTSRRPALSFLKTHRFWPSPAGEKMVPVLQRGALDRSDCGHSSSVSAAERQICCREEPLKTEARLWEVTTDHPWAVVVDSENSEPAGGAGCSTCALVARCSSVTDVVRLAGAVGGPWEPRGMPKRRLSTRAPTDGGTRRGDPLDAIGRCERRSHLKRRTPPIHTPQAPEYGRISPLVRRLY